MMMMIIMSLPGRTVWEHQVGRCGRNGVGIPGRNSNCPIVHNREQRQDIAGTNWIDRPVGIGRLPKKKPYPNK